MAELTISLSDDTAARLRAFATGQGETPEQAARMFIEAALPPDAVSLGSDDPDGSKLLLTLAGALDDLNIEPFKTNEEIDQALAGEYANPHDDK